MDRSENPDVIGSHNDIGGVSHVDQNANCALHSAGLLLGEGEEQHQQGGGDQNAGVDKVAAIGVKWIRIQSGWARTETEKGVYL